MLTSGDTPVPPATTLALAKSYLRLDADDEDDLVTGLIATASACCEAFIAQPLVARAFVETIAAGCVWRRLGRSPVAAITSVAGLTIDDTGIALPVGAYAIDIDANGDGWVQSDQVDGATRLSIGYTAGLAASADELPEPLRQGVIRLVAHLFTNRDAPDEAAPPAAIAALWRPFRRMRLA